MENENKKARCRLSLREWWKLLGRTIYVGDRLKANLTALTWVSLFSAALGIALILLNTVIHPTGEFSRIAMSVATFLAGTFCAYFAHVRKNRRIAILSPLFFCIFVFTMYALTGYAEGTGILWSLLLPLGVCYFVGIRPGILLSAYYSVLYMVVFWTPLGNNLSRHYSQAFMERFPLAYLGLSVFTVLAMVQYHRMALLEIDYTDRLNEEVRRQTAVAEERSRRIEQMSFQTIQTLANAIDAKDPYTKGHSTRVSQYAMLIAEAAGWDRERVNDLRYAALLHDIGKIGVPDAILNRPRKLTDVEYDIIKSHTTMGAEILKDRTIVAGAEDVARSHHERYDGYGYPDQLKGDRISEEARIVAIADAFDAMSSNRVYRKACTAGHIQRELTEGRGRQFDPYYTDLFLGLWEQGRLENILRHRDEDPPEPAEDSSMLLQTLIEHFATQNTSGTVDITTGIQDRTAGEAAIARAIKEESGCLVFLDMDNLKTINDANGHQAGDLALRMMGETLSEEGDDSICCRMGGDEFLLFLKNVTEAEAEDRVRKLMARYEQRKKTDARITLASLSAGMAMSTPADSYTSVYNKADKALYHVKQNGRNGCSFYRDESEHGGTETVDINRLIRSIRDSGSYSGALDVEYRQFAKLYEFVSNLEERFHQPCMFVMITMESVSGGEAPMEETEEAMFCMEQSIRQTIRNVDVLTRYGRLQYLVILVGTDENGVRTAVDRIFRSFFKMNGSSLFSPSYTIAEMRRDEEPA